MATITNENIRKMTLPECRFWQFQGAVLPNGRSVRTIFLLFTKMSEVFYVRGDASC